MHNSEVTLPKNQTPLHHLVVHAFSKSNTMSRRAQTTSGQGETEVRYYHKPTDLNLGSRVAEIVPGADLYTQLQEAERRLDATISRKKLDLQDLLSHSIKQTQTLRVFISNTCAGQPWQQSGNGESSQDSWWNLRIEGRLLDGSAADDEKRLKFSQFFTGFMVEIDDPTLENNVVEWHEPNTIRTNPTQAQKDKLEFDVIDIRRKGTKNTKVKITMQLKEQPDKFHLSPPLARILAVDEETRPGVVVGMWHYIQFHKLQDMDEKRLIKCDGPLRELFMRDAFQFPQIMELLAPHLMPKPPVVFNYVVRTDKESTVGDTIYDLEIKTDDPVRAELIKIADNWESEQQQILAIDEQIAACVHGLNQSCSRRDFFTHLAEDPVNFVDKWVASQARDLKIVSSDKGFNEEDVRRSSFYTKELLDQGLHLFLEGRR